MWNLRTVILNGIYCSVHTTDKTSSKSSSVNLWWSIKKRLFCLPFVPLSLYCFSLWTWLNLSFKQFPSSKFDGFDLKFVNTTLDFLKFLFLYCFSLWTPAPHLDNFKLRISLILHISVYVFTPKQSRKLDFMKFFNIFFTNRHRNPQ